MTSPLATLDANQFFISVIENYSPIFTSFVFPDQYLKPKGYSEKWPIFLETSIPSSVPKHYIAHGNKRIKRLVPHSSSAFPPEWCGRSSRGRRGEPATQGQRGQRAPPGGPSVSAPLTSDSHGGPAGTQRRPRTGLLCFVSGTPASVARHRRACCG